MKNEFKGLTKIFKFTFQQQTGRKGYRTATVVATLLCLIIPIVLLGGGAWLQTREDHAEPEYMEPEEEYFEEYDEEEPEALEPIDLTLLKKIYVVNQTDKEAFSKEDLANFDYLNQVGIPLDESWFVDYGADLEGAMKESKGSSDTLILLTDEDEMGYYVTRVLIPENSTLPENLSMLIAEVMYVYGEDAMTAEQVVDVEDGEDVVDDPHWSEEDEETEFIHFLLGYLLPYLNIMVIYFFVLFYGQSVAQTVLMEKTSKLMEVFLITVRPTAMVLGKVMAVCLSGVLQLSLWIISLITGLLVGCKVMDSIAPEWEVNLIAQSLLDSFGALDKGMFSIGGCFLALLMLLSGMLLFCALAGIGGSLASKVEDLGSANMAFTLILVISFFACLVGGGLKGMDGGVAWIDWIPFTAIMVTPARILIGTVSLGKGLLCLLEVIATALLITFAAGKVYKQMVLYKGKPPKVSELVKILRNKNA